MKYFAIVIVIIGSIGISGCSKQNTLTENHPSSSINTIIKGETIETPIYIDPPSTPAQKTYKEILSSGITPKLAPEYTFPTSHQYKNGCFVFAIKHILNYKYESNFDPYKAEKAINKPRSDLWTAEHIKNLLTEYDIKIVWQSDTKTFFNLLKNGEPVIIQYKYKLSDKKWVGHFVAAYSFDKNGVWISDSISGQLIEIPYTEVFAPDKLKTQFGFATIERDSAN